MKFWFKSRLSINFDELKEIIEKQSQRRYIRNHWSSWKNITTAGLGQGLRDTGVIPYLKCKCREAFMSLISISASWWIVEMNLRSRQVSPRRFAGEINLKIARCISHISFLASNTVATALDQRRTSHARGSPCTHGMREMSLGLRLLLGRSPVDSRRVGILVEFSLSWLLFLSSASSSSSHYYYHHCWHDFCGIIFMIIFHLVDSI